MKRYRIKSAPGQVAHLEILSELNDDILVRIMRRYDGYETHEESYISRDLFDTCVRTAYLIEDTAASLPVAAAS